MKLKANVLTEIFHNKTTVHPFRSYLCERLFQFNYGMYYIVYIATLHDAYYVTET